MKIVVASDQDEHWQRFGYRAADHPIAEAFARPKIEHISRYVDLSSARVLDVGCGNGQFTRQLTKIARSVVGVDTSSFMLTSNPGRLLVQGNAEELPFKTGSFDVAFVSNLLHHVAEPAVVVREAVRLSRRYVVLVEPNRLNPGMAAFGLLVSAERGTLRSSRRYLSRLLQAEGLRVVRCSAMGMISQNFTPGFLVPLLRAFDRELAWGEYLVAIAEKPQKS